MRSTSSGPGRSAPDPDDKHGRFAVYQEFISMHTDQRFLDRHPILIAAFTHKNLVLKQWNVFIGEVGQKGFSPTGNCKLAFWSNLRELTGIQNLNRDGY
ncbi:hypothetical protein [Candidatus Amarobacter glycogenicus]|uniref:hypothetical protein n=1 Tax=Candidatus Amarobacter glycogenicus TaxID=3140699 RepID=UPI002A14CE08|nr:hypothetical protein [Dehalococcoidia bacterium]